MENKVTMTITQRTLLIQVTYYKQYSVPRSLASEWNELIIIFYKQGQNSVLPSILAAQASANGEGSRHNRHDLAFDVPRVFVAICSIVHLSPRRRYHFIPPVEFICRTI